MLRPPFPVMPPTLVHGTWNPPGAISPPPFQGMPPVQAQPRNRMPFPLAQQFRRGGVAGGGPTVDVPTSFIPTGDPSGAGLAPRHLGGSGGYGGPAGFTSPFGTTYTMGPSGSYFNPSGFPRATAVNPGEDSYGLSGGAYAGYGNNIGPQSVAGAAPTGPPFLAKNFKGGGVVPGHRPFGMPHDSVPAMLDPGEVVLNQGEQSKVTLSNREKKALPPNIVAQMYLSRMGR